MRTLNGHKVSDLAMILDQPLPPAAYKAIPGGANLTDIDAGWQRKAFNKIFGICGVGWGFDFDPANIEVRNEEVNKNGKQRVEAYAKVVGIFWFAYKDENGNLCRANISVTGANSAVSGNEAYALKGSITNAIGFGSSMIGWQESVYLGCRSHSNTTGFAPGKGYFDMNACEPEQPPVQVAPAPKPEKPAPKPPVTPPTPKPPVTPPVEKLPEPPENPEQSLAEKAGLESIKHIVCVACGAAEITNEIPEACKACGVVAESAFTIAQNHAHFLVLQKNISERIAAANSAATSKELLEGIKTACGNDRRLILSSLSAAATRTIKNYSEATPAEMRICLDNLATAANPPQAGIANTPAPVNFPPDKPSLCKAIFDLGRGLSLGTPKQIIAEVGRVADKDITSASQLDEEQLKIVFLDFTKRSETV
jgi:hypothetical protein